VEPGARVAVESGVASRSAGFATAVQDASVACVALGRALQTAIGGKKLRMTKRMREIENLVIVSQTQSKYLYMAIGDGVSGFDMFGSCGGGGGWPHAAAGPPRRDTAAANCGSNRVRVHQGSSRLIKVWGSPDLADKVRGCAWVVLV